MAVRATRCACLVSLTFFPFCAVFFAWVGPMFLLQSNFHGTEILQNPTLGSGMHVVALQLITTWPVRQFCYLFDPLSRISSSHASPLHCNLPHQRMFACHESGVLASCCFVSVGVCGAPLCSSSMQQQRTHASSSTSSQLTCPTAVPAPAASHIRSMPGTATHTHLCLLWPVRPDPDIVETQPLSSTCILARHTNC